MIKKTIGDRVFTIENKEKMCQGLTLDMEHA